jgi:hypothetical protein
LEGFKLSDWEVVKDDGDTIVLKRRPDGDGCGCLIVIILLVIFFSEPSYNDLAKEKYLEKAESAVENYVISWQEKNWEGWGWKPKSIFNFNEPQYEVEIANWKRDSYESIGNRVEYLKNGYYKVIVVTNTNLKSKKGDYGRVLETFSFLIKRESNGEYKILEVEKIDMNPSQEKFDEMLRHWSNSN